jgi:Polyketide cyclase / dehydrase and lipid transport
MGPISLTTAVDASREEVFDFIVDLSNRPAWTDHFVSDFRLERIPAAGQGAAARFRVDAPAGMRYMETVIAEADRPHKVVEHGRGGRWDRIPIHTTWELKEGGGVTTVVLNFWTRPDDVMGKVRELGRSRWWRRRWSKALARMRELIETGAEVPRAEVAGADRVPAATH